MKTVLELARFSVLFTAVFGSSFGLSAQQLCCASLSGRVTIDMSGHALSNATITLQGPKMPESAHTDQNGRYSFGGLQAGTYYITAQAIGYSAVHTARYTKLVLTSSDHITEADFTMEQPTVLVGKLTNDRNGPLPFLRISIWKQVTDDHDEQSMTFVGHGVSDSSGHFRIESLPPGKYFLVASPEPLKVITSPASTTPDKPSLAYVTSFYPGLDSFSGSLPVSLRAGTETDVGTFRVLKQKAFCMTASLGQPRPEAGEPRSGSVALTQELGSLPITLATTQLAFPAKLKICGIPPGEYDFQAVTSGRLYQESLQIVSENISLGYLSEAAPVSVSVALRVPGLSQKSSDLKQATSLLIPFRRPGYPGEALNQKISLGSSSVFQPVYSGLFTLRLLGLPDSNYLKQISVDGQPILRQPFPVQAGTIDVLLATDGSSLSGTVLQDNDNQPDSDCIVLLRQVGSSDLAPLAATRLRERTDQNGHFAFAGVVPGTYHISAVHSLPIFRRDDLDLGTRLTSEEVSLQPRERKTLILHSLLAPEN